MDISEKKERIDDIKKIENFLTELGFASNSNPTAQNIIYSKNNEVIIIKNKN